MPTKFRLPEINLDNTHILCGYCNKEDDELVSEVTWIAYNIWIYLSCIQRQGQQIKYNDYIYTLYQY